jgi:uncharacterized protein (TIGR02266 family)
MIRGAARLAQLDRALASGAKGRRFDSCIARIGRLFSFASGEISMAVNDRRQGRADGRLTTEKKKERRSKERRRGMRVPVQLWVEEMKGEDLYFQHAANISMGGIFFERTIPHPRGTRVSLRFKLPGVEGVIETTGEVVSGPGRSDGTGAGIKFIDLDPVEEKMIRDFINKKNP